MDGDLPLGGRVALVTGASRGIGRAVALRLAAGGAAVGLTARAETALAAVRAAALGLGARACTVPGDVRDEADVRRVLRRTEEELGPVDILVNNAGVGHFAPVERLAVAQWDEMMAVNARAAFLFAREALPGMRARDRGHVVNIASVAATTVFRGGAGYCASKWAVMALSETLRAETRGTGVRVTAVCPGSVDTGFEAGARAWALRPEDVAEVVFQAVTARAGAIINTVLLRPQVPGSDSGGG